MRIAAVIVINLVVNTSLLIATYPIWEEFSYARYPRGYWLKVYAMGGLLSTAIVIAATVMSRWLTRQRTRRSRAFWQIGTVFIALSIWAVTIGINLPASDVSWPDLIQGVDAKLFAEAQFLRFIFCDAIPMAVISWLLVAMLGLERGTRSLHPPS
ncbi:MAG TPA: hypothetical protein VF532_05205 [Candidatus Angelobacter sp.]